MLADAAKAGALLYAFGATLISLEIWVIPAPAFPQRIWWVPVCLVPTLVLLALIMWRAPHRLPPLWWPFISVLAIGVILFLALVSHDPSASSQLAYCWPVLFASYHLRAGVRGPSLRWSSARRSRFASRSIPSRSSSRTPSACP